MLNPGWRPREDVWLDFMAKGTAASRGLVCGRVQRVGDYRPGMEFGRDCILVARFPLTAYTPLLDRAGALVCAQGGPLAALITLAREYRVPAVIGLGVAIDSLRDGDTVWVDGSAGVVSSFDPRGAWQVNIASVVRAEVSPE